MGCGIDMKLFICKFYFLGDFLQLVLEYLLLYVFLKWVVNDICFFLSKVRNKDLKFCWLSIKG